MNEDAGRAAEDIADGANAFAFKLGAELTKKNGDGNLIFSPFSAWVPLAALLGAAVNRWACERTDGYITGIVEEFEPDTVAAIANAVFVSDRWVAEVSAPPPKTFTMDCDRPFVYFLYDFIGVTPLVLFAGVINRP